MSVQNSIDDDVLLLSRPKPGVCVMRLNRPSVRNALNLALRRRLAEAFLAAQNDAQIRCVVLAGSDEAFCSGADLRDYLDMTTPELIEKRLELTWEAIRACPVPVIAAVCGYALGGGCELALHADVIIAGKSTMFGQPEIRVGLMPGAGATQRLIRTIGKARTMDLLLTGRRISADEALAMGIVSRLVDDDKVEAEAIEIATQIASGPQLASRLIKEAVVQGAETSLAAGLAFERKCFQVLFSSADKKEGIGAFLEKRPPKFT